MLGNGAHQAGRQQIKSGDETERWIKKMGMRAKNWPSSVLGSLNSSFASLPCPSRLRDPGNPVVDENG